MRTSTRGIWTTGILLLALFPALLQAQQLFTLQDGSQVQGRVVAVEGDAVRVDVFLPSRNAFASTTYRRTDILRIEEAATGKDLTGKYLGAVVSGQADVSPVDAESESMEPERSRELVSPVTKRVITHPPEWDDPYDPNTYRTELALGGDWTYDHRWHSQLRATHTFAPLRHDEEHMTVASKRVVPRSWIGGRSRFGHISHDDGDETRMSGRLEGAGLIDEDVAFGGVFEVRVWEFDNRSSWHSDVLISLSGFLLDLYPSDRVHLREAVMFGSTRDHGYLQYFNPGWSSKTIIRFEHMFDVMIHRNAYSHTLTMESIENARTTWNFTNYYEIVTGPSVTITPILRLFVDKQMGDAAQTYTSVGAGLRYYPSPTAMLFAHVQMGDNEADLADQYGFHSRLEFAWRM